MKPVRMLLLILLLTLLPSALADGEPVPEEILSVLSGGTWRNYTVAVVTYEDGTAIEPHASAQDPLAFGTDGENAFAVMKNGSRNVLVVLVCRSGKWHVRHQSEGCLLQGNWVPRIYVEQPGVFSVEYMGALRSPSLSLNFTLRSGTWYLTDLFERSSGSATDIAVYGNRLEFRDEASGKLTTVKGVVANRLEQIYLSNFPRTAEQARYKLTNPPDIPTFTGTRLIPDPADVRFGSNQRYPVYSGPSERYVRGALGKAVLSSNDWVQVFGNERAHGKTWLMVQYAISSEQMRIGWIQAEMPGSAEPIGLHGCWLFEAAALSCSVPLTDDPLHSGSPLLQLEAGQEVTLLARLGSTWAYVEVSSAGSPVRGFVPQRALKAASQRIVAEADARAAGEAWLRSEYPEFASADITSTQMRFFDAESSPYANPYYHFIYYIGDMRFFYDVEVQAVNCAILRGAGPGDPGNG